MEVLGRLLALLALLLTGTGLRAAGVLNEARTDWLNAVAYYVALPALIFVATYDRSVADLLTPALLVGLLVVLFGTAALAWVVHRNLPSRPRRSVAVIQSYHSNLGYLGLPLVAATFDGDVTAVASVVLGVVSLVQVPLTVFVLVGVNDADAAFGHELRRLATNPVLAALVGGLAVGSAGLAVPSPVAAGLDALGTLSLPLALLCVGASLDLDLPSVDYGTTAAVIAVKMGWMPLLAWAVFSVLGVDTATFTASVVMLGTPTAVSTYVFANELGGDEEFASLNVFVTTLASVGTLFLLIELVG
ncbi:AEC family transporter [Halostella sp. JP-L12]|uniref:AEC family transporter n=1 Tax=Halostella TaxID=1843185 RepID=UPI000EF82614|nr:MULTISPECIES: AEC family transporter [Halostella]NHN49438.1 AEC family transporter [Halostella sp. JP-L12]